MPSSREALSDDELRRVNARIHRLISEAENLERKLVEDLLDVLAEAQRAMRDLVSSSPAVLATALDEMTTILDRVEAELVALMGPALAASAALGVRLADEPIGIVGGTLPKRNERDLDELVTASGAHAAVVLGGVVASIKSRMSAQLTRVVVAGDDPREVAASIGSKLEGSVVFGRPAASAAVAAKTETGATQGAATQMRLEQAADQNPGLRKRWVWSHKKNGRRAHAAAETRYSPGGSPGPIPIDEEFVVGRGRARYPRSASLPGGDRFGCGCRSVPVFVDEGNDE